MPSASPTGPIVTRRSSPSRRRRRCAASCRAGTARASSSRTGATGFSFASAELLYATLGITPGSVTPFAVINDGAGRVTVVLDAEMLEISPLNYHPLTNEATIAVAPADLLRFLADCGHAPRTLHLSDLEREAAQ